MPETDDKPPEIVADSRLASLLNALFVTNSTYYVTPLNAESVVEQLGRAEREKKKLKAKELHDSLLKVKEAAEKDGGISEATYEAHKYAINSLARDLLNERWWGSSLTHRCEQEDREGKKATLEQIARFPKDKNYSEGEYGHTNILDEGCGESGFEGTLFQTDYDEQGNLKTYRIFHQGHRNTLHIKTVDILGLLEKINEFVTEYTDDIRQQQFGFTLDREGYLQKIREFNDKFGDLVTIEVVNGYVVAKFPVNPRQLAKGLVTLGEKNGMGLEAIMGTMTYIVSYPGGPNYIYVDLFLPAHLWGSSEKFDPEKHKNAPTMILPYLNPEFSSFLIQMYISQ